MARYISTPTECTLYTAAGEPLFHMDTFDRDSAMAYCSAKSSPLVNTVATIDSFQNGLQQLQAPIDELKKSVTKMDKMRSSLKTLQYERET